MGILLATLALVVWFGVQRGLRPLLDLQGAIATRSPVDLSRNKRSVPVEARGIVATVNRLLGQVETSITAHQEFISDAAHQLRNPSAAALSMAEAVRDAKSLQESKKRGEELVEAARAASRVTEQLLSLDPLRQDGIEDRLEPRDAQVLVEEICSAHAAEILAEGIDF